MRVVLISSADIDGGAAAACYNLHKSLLREGVESFLVVQKKNSDDYSVLGPGNHIARGINLFRPALNQLPVKIYRERTGQLFSPVFIRNRKIVSVVNALKPDLIHLHWINGGMLTPEMFRHFKAPLIWTCHDAWPFTGGCHILNECRKYKDACGSCPTLGSKNTKDLSYKIWKRKRKNFDKIRYVTTPSSWMSMRAEESSLFCDIPVGTVANGIDTSQFKPVDKKTARDMLVLPLDAKIILFGAITATGDRNKGWDLLQEALRFIDNRKDVQVVVVGASEPEDKPDINLPVKYLGRMHDSIALAVAYSSADVTVIPSRQESFGLMAAESIACGTPVVAFDTSGLKDIIQSERDGFLAKCFEPEDFAGGINKILNNKSVRNNSDAEESVKGRFDLQTITLKFMEIYETILNNND